MKKLVLIFGFILMIGFVSSLDASYVAKNHLVEQEEVIGLLQGMGHNVNVVYDKDLKTYDFNGSDLLVIDHGIFRNRNYIPVGDYPSIIMNGYYAKQWGVIDRGNIGKRFSSGYMKIDNAGEHIQVYNKRRLNGGISLGYYFIPQRFRNAGFESIAMTTGYRKGDVISCSDNKCFFGIVNARYWTEDVVDMFHDSVNSLVGEEIEEPVCGNEILEESEECDDGNLVNLDGCSDQCLIEDYECLLDEDCLEGNCIEGFCVVEEFEEDIHDVGINDLELTEEVTEVIQGESIRVYIDVENFGDYDEDVTFEGRIKSEYDVVKTFSHNPIVPLLVGERKENKYKTVTFDIAPGVYTIEVEAIVEQDDVPENNLALINIEVI